ncbi:MAG: AraC family transcriptional regulator [Clostridiales bacterium]|nr:AraC family transcriptional regulator [Clostridiales bacterium]
MKAIFEKYREEISDIEVQRNRYGSFYLHFHSNVEITFVLSGEMTVLHNGKTYVLDRGSIFFADSYDIHGVIKNEKGCSDNCTLIIPIGCLSRFNFNRNNLRIKSPVIKNYELCKKCVDIIDNLVSNSNSVYQRECGTELILSMLLTEFDFSVYEFNLETELIRKVLSFIHNNYTKKIKLNDIAKSLGYTETHISKTFHKYLNVSIPTYINRLRLQYIDKVLKENKNAVITKVIFDAGFSSIQSYYRNKTKKVNKIE